MRSRGGGKERRGEENGRWRTETRKEGRGKESETGTTVKEEGIY